MPDYEKMYFKLFGEVENTINALVKAQQSCEELFLESVEQDTKENADGS